MSDQEPSLTFFQAIGEQLEECVRHFKDGQRERAAKSLENALKLCEDNPTYAQCHVIALQASLHQIVHGFISNAVAKRRVGNKMIALLARSEAMKHGIH